MIKYLSPIYDLTSFGIFNIKNAIVVSDIDDGILIDVSFNGGLSFMSIEKLNTKFQVSDSTGKIQVRISFTKSNSFDEYKIKTNGHFQNLIIGTNINFTNLTTKKNYQTIVGRNGYYNILLPSGLYEVWYMGSGIKQIISSSYNPEVVNVPHHRLDKEAIIDGIFRDIDWAKYSVFETFSDVDILSRSNAILDPDGDLSDGLTNRKCRYWIIGFE